MSDKAFCKVGQEKIVQDALFVVIKKQEIILGKIGYLKMAH